MPVVRFLATHKREANLQQSNIKESTLTSGVFEPASSHLRFNKDASQLRSVYASIFSERKAEKY